VKSKRKITYPEYMLEGYVLPDPKRPHENLPRSLRGKSLTQQLLADEAIRLNLKRRFKKKMQAAGGWHEKKGKDGKTRVPNKTSKVARPLPARARESQPILSARMAGSVGPSRSPSRSVPLRSRWKAPASSGCCTVHLCPSGGPLRHAQPHS